MSGQTFVMAFELTDAGLDMTLAELIREAATDRVSQLLAEHRVILTGPISWQMDPDEHTPHLIGRAPALDQDAPGRDQPTLGDDGAA